ncbi:hypothetical protein CAPTEDRAFT_221890 [Capitella teleta]|uniref:ASCH domain-containing protein n=1 Tax=Capitella teleta TaxID=283909 RepID=R7T3K6_CAPTE|nr:hypothetical protein CAPTEDRAFT_221890 [Capitella teleta]|eukprot:ELT87196.1 hypothetical protein CAPTEDRAFT_221890 [Capitella teleta]
MAAPTVKWICQELTKILGVETSEDIARYMLAIESASELKEYLGELLDTSVPRNRRFIEELIKRWRPPAHANLPAHVQVYKKSNEEESYISGKSKNNKKERKQAPPPQNDKTPTQNGVSEKKTPDSQKAKTKFVPLFNEEGEHKSATLPGRHACECQAYRHPLINNCTSCGRIVCGQEGSGPCLFCGQLVCSKEEQEVLNRGSKKSERLRNSLINRGGQMKSTALRMQDGLEKALAHKEKLLNFDKTSAKRTKVLDDESDYFTTDSNAWLSDSEKAALQKREDELRAVRHASRLDKKFTFDFAGRQVREDVAVVDVYNADDEVVQQVHFGAKKNEGNAAPTFSEDDFVDLVNPSLTHGTTLENDKNANLSNFSDDKKKQMRIQDRELREMSDEGSCMSMHQPWASLLILGIKKHEGRSWYSSHRGRLWIAATAKTPADEDIAMVEDQYRTLYKRDDIPFPSEYPSGCLLGCVDVQSVFAQDEYRQQFPDGESSSDFVFVCSSPHELLVKFPVKGRHKIYKLDRNIHQAAKKGIRSVNVKL